MNTKKPVPGINRMDSLDKKILGIISQNARIPFRDVALQCGVSRAAIHQRVQKMFDDGIITGSGYHAVSFEKTFSMDENGFESLFFMHVHMNQELLFSKITELFYDQSVGNVVRVKGFLMTGETENKWIEINATHHGIHINPIKEGQEVLIVIGENLKKEKLDSYFDSKYSSCRLE